MHVPLDELLDTERCDQRQERINEEKAAAGVAAAITGAAFALIAVGSAADHVIQSVIASF